MCPWAKISDLCIERLTSQWVGITGTQPCAVPWMCVEGCPVVLTEMGSPWCCMWSAHHLDLHPQISLMFCETSRPSKGEMIEGEKRRCPVLGLADGRFWEGRHPTSSGRLTANRYTDTVSTWTYIVYITIGNWKLKLRAWNVPFV